MTILEYDKREFRLVEIGIGEIYRAGYQKMYLANGFYCFLADNDDHYSIPKGQVIVRRLSSINWLPRL